MQFLAERVDDPEHRPERPVAVLQHEDEGQVDRHGQLCGRVKLDLAGREIAGEIELSLGALAHRVADQEVHIGIAGKRHRAALLPTS